MKKTRYGVWEVHPFVSLSIRQLRRDAPVRKRMTAKHKGDVLCFK